LGAFLGLEVASEQGREGFCVCMLDQQDKGLRGRLLV